MGDSRVLMPQTPRHGSASFALPPDHRPPDIFAVASSSGSCCDGTPPSPLTGLLFSRRFASQTETGRRLEAQISGSPASSVVIVFMNSDLLAVLDYMEREKGIKREVLLDALSSALLTAAKKSVGPARDLRVTIDPKSGEITALANLIVVESVQNIHDEIPIARARKIKPDAAVGDNIEVEVTPEGFGRIAAQTARQAILQRIRRAE